MELETIERDKLKLSFPLVFCQPSSTKVNTIIHMFVLKTRCEFKQIVFNAVVGIE